MSYRYLLFDLDHTLLDFDKAEDLALQQLLEEAGVDDVPAYMAYYVPMNRALWEDLALGKITKQELIKTRFARLFAHFGQEVDGAYYAQRYQYFLSQQGQVLPGAKALLEILKARGYHIFAATNGVTFIQKGRLERSGIAQLFKQVFISDELGFQKPCLEFYEKIAQAIPGFLTQLKAIKRWGRDPEDDLAFITQPTLIVNGDKDMQVPTKNSYIMHGKIKNSQLIIYPQAGHGSIFQMAEDFAPKLIAFLKEG